jgi:pyruvate/2-oxoglutarate/acetoin dehydrogenase E1 component
MMAVRDAINAAIDEEMARDKRVFVMGEVNVPSVSFSVHSPYHIYPSTVWSS